LGESLASLIARLGRSSSVEVRRGVAHASTFGWADLERALVRSPDAWRRRDGRGRRQLSLAVESALLSADDVLEDRGPWGGLSTSLERVRRALNDGATLMVNDVHALCPPLGRIAEQASAGTSNRVTLRAFASTGRTPGFRPHIDLSDTIVLQTVGRKAWTVWKRRGPRPVKDDVVVHSAPSDDPVWQGVLEAGDVLFVPAGWWHRPVGIGEPSLHLSFDIHSVFGWDVLRTGRRQDVMMPGASSRWTWKGARDEASGWTDLVALAHLGREGTFFHDPADGAFPSPIRVHRGAREGSLAVRGWNEAATPEEIDAALASTGVVRVEHVERFLSSVQEQVSKVASGARATAALVGRGPAAALFHSTKNDLLVHQLEGCGKWHVTAPDGTTSSCRLKVGGELQIRAGSHLCSPPPRTHALHLEIEREPLRQRLLHRLRALDELVPP
jgi:hypothetical protein